MWRRILIIALIANSAMFLLSSCSPQSQEKAAQTKISDVKIVDVNNKYCPISGEEIKGGLVSSYVHDGKRYRFCCAGCTSVFKKDPDKYIKIIEGGEYLSSSGNMQMR